VLDDDDGGFGELGDELPAGVEVDEIVIGEFLTLELGGAGDACAGPVGVNGGKLVRVLAVAQDGGTRLDDADGGRESLDVETGCCVSVIGRCDGLEGLSDGCVVGCSSGEGLLCEVPASCAG